MFAATKSAAEESFLVFVGGSSARGSSTATPSFSLTSLSGGVASSPQSGDIVIACVAFENGTNRDIECTTSGYTEIADLYQNSDNDGQLGVFYKVLSGSDTSVAFDIKTAQEAGFVVHVWRNISNIPLDATSTTSTNNGRPNPPAITTVTNNAVVIAVGASGGSLDDQLSNPTVPSGMTNFFQNNLSNESAIAIASVLVSSPSTYDPAQFGGFSTATKNGACAVTIALRPK